jgi:hypothetical protein
LRFAREKEKEKEKEKGEGSALSPTLSSPVSHGGHGKEIAEAKANVKRRHSHEPKVNVYTECGRHGDDWLG